MKTSFVALSILLTLAATLCAQPAPNPVAAPLASKALGAKTGRVMSPAVRSNLLAKTGGFIHSADSGPTLLFINTQKRVAASAVEAPADQIRKLLRLSATFRSRPSPEPVTEALKALSDTNTAAVVVIADIAGYPALLVAPESRWALVNVAALSSGGASSELLADRVQKEIWRAFGYLMGAANSSFELCLMKSVLTPEDLDGLKAKTLCPEPLGKIVACAQKLGMKPTRMTTYRKAVEEGWAPAPTNDIQRAVWQELKQ